MVAERAGANSWPAWLEDVACRAGSTLDETLQEVDIQTLTGICLADARWRQTANFWPESQVDIIDVIACKSLGKNVREQADIDKLMVEALEGAKNEWGWSKAKLGANTFRCVDDRL